jgi:hypothetical protein
VCITIRIMPKIGLGQTITQQEDLQ